MKNARAKKKRSVVGDMKPEYRFDYRKARPNRFAAAMKKGSRVVVLDPDVAKAFPDSTSVNAALRLAKRDMKRAV